MNRQGIDEKGLGGLLRTQVVRNARVIKYGIVGVFGILLNLATMALLLRFIPAQSWVPSAIANVVSTIVNFMLHNLWTFSDRAHQGMRMLRGFVFYVLMCAVGIFITTVAYVQFLRIAVHMPLVTAHIGKSLIPLGCQSAAIVLGAAINYILNKQFTWPETQQGEAEAEVSTQTQSV